DFPENISVALIGSCTNSSYEDIDRCANIAKQAMEKGLKAKIPFIITPGSEQVRATMEKDGQLKILQDFGGQLLANACGPCIGMWKRMDNELGERNTIVTSYNRNFSKRNDGNPNTLAFVASPELVTAMVITGKLSFDPTKDKIVGENGEEIVLDSPTGKELPQNFEQGEKGVIKGESHPEAEVKFAKGSSRIAKLEPFEQWDGNDFVDMPILIKAKGKCTTDHISPAGKWLKLRGHLDNLSDNMYIGAINYFTDEVGRTKNQISKKYEETHVVARHYKKEGLSWVVFGEENLGEGSAREQAAMEPRYLGGRAIIVKSFARIHETNLKKQGVLALTFDNKDDFEKIMEDDRVSIIRLSEFSEGIPLKMIIKHSDGTIDEIMLNHTYNGAQIEWFKAGSALNIIAKENIEKN
ncbi:aconitate hydratase, partial [archaeon]|nr:aconitate hydratase [archaeon]